MGEENKITSEDVNILAKLVNDLSMMDEEEDKETP
jgi:hypothetical protein